MHIKAIAAGIGALFVLLLATVFMFGLVGHNNDQTWVVYQSISGNVDIVSRPGYFWKGFGTTWYYPRTLEASYSDSPDDGDHGTMKVTFNDGGTAQVGAFVKVILPTDDQHRRMMHQEFRGDPNNISTAIRAHLNNVIGASGPVMSASENQSSRKSEFNHLVEAQLAKGLFKMRRTEIELADLTEIEDGGVDAQGNKIQHEKKAKVMATEVVNDRDGQPIVIQLSPLTDYGLVIRQFSITSIDYDPQTLAQFAAKKESYLNAEKSKAQRQEEVQQRLMVEEKGRRQSAEIEAEENMKKTRAIIQATQAAEVAAINKQQAVTVAQQRTEVALQLKNEAENLRQIAEINAATAELAKKSAISTAEAKQKEIELGGGITEKDRVLAQINADRDARVAEALSKVNVPGTVIVGGGEGAGGLTENLLNMALLRSTGVLDKPVSSSPPPEAARK